jgi:NDP-sugar pyrophosphorylase family protein
VRSGGLPTSVKRALLLAAGRGTRIQSLIADRPKPLIQVGQYTVLEHNLRQLSGAGVREVWINLHHLGDQIQGLVGDGSRYGLRVTYAPEDELLGTAGTLKRLAREFARDTFLVVYGDNLTAIDLTGMVAYHRRCAATATIAVFDPLRVPNTGMAGGRVVIAADGRVVAFQEGVGASGQYVNAGVYVLEPEALSCLPMVAPADFGRDVFPRMLEAGRAVFGYCMDGYCLAIDTPEALQRAETLIGAVSPPLTVLPSP